MPQLPVREVYRLEATDAELAAVERALRAAELERKHLLDAAKDHKRPAGGNALSRSR